MTNNLLRRPRRRSRSALLGWLQIILVGGCIAAALALAVFSIWARATWPCDRLSWMPAKDLPGRCVQVTIFQGGNR